MRKNPEHFSGSMKDLLFRPDIQTKSYISESDIFLLYKYVNYSGLGGIPIIWRQVQINLSHSTG
jgi:hypothetical protein